MNKIELLAPAGSKESLYAAINKGADAVYLGGSKFSARAYASNFNDEQLEEVLDYAHMYGVKVYITINTLIKENEFDEALSYIDFLYRIGVDGLIIQDLGLFNETKKKYTQIELHGSTQMTVHNGDGALFFKDSGFKRIVLSRELSLKEIEYISKELDIETEIFVHGALCVCYSGQCLMSSMIGGRSGNRGRCAQSCRLPYNIIRIGDKTKKEGYLLSPKDMCTIEDVEQIVNTGTSSLKIEGRMKRPEYVAGVVESYRNAVDSVIDKNKDFNVKASKDTLMQLFNREGFSKAYLYKNEGKDMMAFKNPKNTGVYIGSVNSKGEVLLEKSISVGDGISCGKDGFTISKILSGKNSLENADEGMSVKLLPARYKNNDKLYKTLDVELMDKYKTSYLNPYENKIEIKASMIFKVGEPMIIALTYNDKDYEVKGEVVQTALKKPLSKDKVEENIMKSGETPYKISSIEFLSFEQGFVPVSSINSLRREIIEAIEANEIKKFKREVSNEDYDKSNYNKRDAKEFKGVLYTVRTKQQLKAVVENNCENYAIDIFGKSLNSLLEKDIENIDLSKVYFKVPNIIKDEYQYVCSVIDKYIDNIKGIVTANAGIIYRYNSKTSIIGDYKLNIFNSKAVEFYEKSIDVLPISVELNRSEMISVTKGKKSSYQALIYGRVEMMVSEYCPIGSTFGQKSSNNNCNQSCVKDDFILEDRMKEKFVMTTDRFCRSHIYNSVPLNLIDEMDRMEQIGISSFRVDFIDEDYNEVSRIIRVIKKEEEDNKNINYTKGHYKRGVE
ncbi:U32 family peptidase [Clostridium folliculivorans]|uniref:Peptidase U32 n=1 Tax=Clostridium folliculivorans TaxID=2886038 RepID=A0A9W5XZQ4_9CLOT|nr:U32 family peptidase [Clostridium folliculivorans]GKU23933.1 peptidase U32 [Clostridium folliculivorans]GKU30048.1 peptidase U32 [Clostridium folliculivorans]